LLAESTGKHGLGLIPIDGEPQNAPEAYGSDRLFVSLSLDGERDAARAAWLDRLADLGHPVVEITLARPESVVQEFVRWEVATAIAGTVIGINPFDQPDVEAGKLAARRLSEAYERGEPPASANPIWQGEGMAAFAEGTGAIRTEDPSQGLAAVLAAFLAQARAGDYVGLLAWLDRNEAHTAALQRIRASILKHKGVATVLGFGPRYLHSTGQAYKGGPNTGLFLAITGGGGPEIAIPGRKLTFGQVEAAQALGDLAVLVGRGRRVLRVDLGGDVERGLGRLEAALEMALP
jgi:transaldolase / glucose-6-phosphate isomerase